MTDKECASYHRKEQEKAKQFENLAYVEEMREHWNKIAFFHERAADLLEIVSQMDEKTGDPRKLLVTASKEGFFMTKEASILLRRMLGEKL